MLDPAGPLATAMQDRLDRTAGLTLLALPWHACRILNQKFGTALTPDQLEQYEPSLIEAGLWYQEE